MGSGPWPLLTQMICAGKFPVFDRSQYGQSQN